MNSDTAYVFDASLLVAFLRPSEPFHPDTDALLRKLTAAKSILYVPAILFSEVAAAIARGEDNASRALRAVAHLSQLPGLQIVPVDETLGGLAAQVAAIQRIRGCDAVYVALALILNAPLITLDRQQRERAPGVVVTQTPGQTLAKLQTP